MGGRNFDFAQPNDSVRADTKVSRGPDWRSLIQSRIPHRRSGVVTTGTQCVSVLFK